MVYKDISDKTIKEGDIIKVNEYKDLLFIVQRDHTFCCTGCCFKEDRFNGACRKRVIYCQSNRVDVTKAYVFKVFMGL